MQKQVILRVLGCDVREGRFSSMKSLIARASDTQEFSISANSAVFLISFVFREVGFVSAVTEMIMSDVLKVVSC